MHWRLATTVFAALCAMSTFCSAQEFPELPQPVKEHEWLQQLAGHWTTECNMTMEGVPPMTSQGTEHTRLVGGFWIIGEYAGNVMGMQTLGIMTLGYDPERKKYIGHWIDNMTSYRWDYEGTVDESGKVLTLNTRGPCPQREGEMTDFRETVELQSPDHKVFKSSVLNPDGNWTTFLTIHSRRKTD